MVAIIERETDEDYVAVQYVVQNNWELHLTKSKDANGDVWIMHRKTPEGEMVLLKGKRKVFEAAKEKHPKLYK